MNHHERSISIGSREVGANHPPFVVAELSGNHNGSLDRALAIVDAASRSGAHALKLQTYTADAMTLRIGDGDFRIDDDRSLWNGRSLHDLYAEAHTPWSWHEPIFDRCRELGLICFSTPFDTAAVELLESLDAPAYKIASFELGDLPLVARVAATGKPLVLSTGMATAGEIGEAVATARRSGCRDLILLKCTSTYPAAASNSHLRTIPHMRELFDAQVGVSDHTAGIGAALAAVALGATMIEKHLTLSRADGGVDAAFSLEPAELRSLVADSDRAWQALGRVSYGPLEAERRSLAFRRSLYVAQDVRAGEPLSEANVRAVRPGHGLPVKYLEVVLGRCAARDAAAGTPVDWDLLGAPVPASEGGVSS